MFIIVPRMNCVTYWLVTFTRTKRKDRPFILMLKFLRQKSQFFKINYWKSVTLQISTHHLMLKLTRISMTTKITRQSHLLFQTALIQLKLFHSFHLRKLAVHKRKLLWPKFKRIKKLFSFSRKLFQRKVE